VKGLLGVRPFLSRGLETVRTEWRCVYDEDHEETPAGGSGNARSLTVLQRRSREPGRQSKTAGTAYPGSFTEVCHGFAEAVFVW
jgi:hypothetical protein